ncbi:MAG: hypothetical protein EOO41_03515, partial [Methanobacteriota archaeon]
MHNLPRTSPLLASPARRGAPIVQSEPAAFASRIPTLAVRKPQVAAGLRGETDQTARTDAGSTARSSGAASTGQSVAVQLQRSPATYEVSAVPGRGLSRPAAASTAPAAAAAVATAAAAPPPLAGAASTSTRSASRGPASVGQPVASSGASVFSGGTQSTGGLLGAPASTAAWGRGLYEIENAGRRAAAARRQAYEAAIRERNLVARKVATAAAAADRAVNDSAMPSAPAPVPVPASALAHAPAPTPAPALGPVRAYAMESRGAQGAGSSGSPQMTSPSLLVSELPRKDERLLAVTTDPRARTGVALDAGTHDTMAAAGVDTRAQAARGSIVAANDRTRGVMEPTRAPPPTSSAQPAMRASSVLVNEERQLMQSLDRLDSLLAGLSSRPRAPDAELGLAAGRSAAQTSAPGAASGRRAQALASASGPAGGNASSNTALAQPGARTRRVMPNMLAAAGLQSVGAPIGSSAGIVTVARPASALAADVDFIIRPRAVEAAYVQVGAPLRPAE